ncbi:MAG TPA: hypothetical protein VM890_00890, partial [Longimicrobium sp.]|nr:hypothetical protein [Longimicrobium sp.]
MDPHAGKLVLNGAPSQYARLLPSPDALRARVDGRSPAELRAFAVRLAGLVRFYGLDGRVDGDWSAFFLADPAMLEASLGAAAPRAAEDAVAELGRRALEAGDRETRGELLHALFAATHGAARQADAWLRAARGIGGGAARRMERRLAAAIAAELAPALRRLHGWHAQALRAGVVRPGEGMDPAGFSPEWKLDGASADDPLFGADGGEGVEAAVPRLVEAFGGAAEALAALRDVAEGLGDAAPEGTQKPPVALFDAFAHLFGTAQATLNTLVPRYADFYYREVLREPERGPVPDRVYLAFALEDGATAAARVPRGATFPAGKDAEGRAIVYAAERSLSVTPAALARVRMLRAARGPLIVSDLPVGSPPWIEEDTVVRQVLASRLLGKKDAEAEGEEILAGDGWPTFGGGEAGAVGRLVTEPAALGFALASPELLLTGGRRFMAIGFRFVPGAALEARLGALADAVGVEPCEALRRVLEAALTLELSTADGWFPLEGYRAVAEPPAPWEDEASFTLGIDLPPAVPAIVPLWQGVDPPPEPEPGSPDAVNPAPGLPTLKAYLRPGTVRVSGPAGSADVYPLPFLDPLRVGTVDVRTRVRGLADLELANTDGPVDPSAPFPVFGGTPAAGSYLELRSRELFAKVPAWLTVTLRWLGLPSNADGFRGWYRDYVVGLDGAPQRGLFDNCTFGGRWSVASPGRWELRGLDDGVEAPYEPVFLFRTRAEGESPPRYDCDTPVPAPDGPLCAESRFLRLPVAATARIPAYYDPAASALRLALAEPPYAFGGD